jgi:type II secretory pathway pseudopilin PulG
VDEGAIPVLSTLLQPSSLNSLDKQQRKQVTTAVITIFQNISESRYRSGRTSSFTVFYENVQIVISSIHYLCS